MEKSSDFENLHQFGQLNEVGKGIDSVVHRFRTSDHDMMIKEYSKFVMRFGEPLTKDVLSSYYADTERAQSLIEKNHNPLNQKITIKDRNCDLNYIVVSQGGVLLEGEKIDYLNGDPTDTIPLVASQSNIPAKNLGELFEGNYEADWRTNKQ